MARNAQYQPTREKGHTVSSAQEVHYTNDFKQADIAGGVRRERVKKAKNDNPNLN